VLKMRWRRDVCHMQNVCDVSNETRFFAVILMAKKDHESLSRSCEWVKIHGCLLHPSANSKKLSSDASQLQRSAMC
jgi:hypothetical protein